MPDGLDLSVEALLPPFAGRLPTALRILGERALLRSRCLTRNTYSTQRFLCGDVERRSSLLKRVESRIGIVLDLEGVSNAVASYARQHGFTLASDLCAYGAPGVLLGALNDVLEPHCSLSLAVSELVWRCHIIVAEADECDVSFSDPGIPFSIFISVPIENSRESLLRVAESIVHETMHLQLSLFEAHFTLVDTSSISVLHSPWKNCERPVQGVLHGLYVFHVLHWMWQRVSELTNCEADRAFALRRTRDIEKEIRTVWPLQDSPALTEAGKLFVQHVLCKHRNHLEGTGDGGSVADEGVPGYQE